MSHEITILILLLILEIRNLTMLFFVKCVIIRIGEIFMKKFLNSLGINPKDISLYEQAFRHTSYCYEKNIKDSYERLEFLGDAILDLAISDYLYNNNDYQEGTMTRIRASYVCENAVAVYAEDLGFSKYVMLKQFRLSLNP